MKAHHAGDPRWITAKFNSNCSRCGLPIVKGSLIWYYPGPKYVMCERPDCGKQAAEDFRAAAHDEEILSGGTQYEFSY